jgi:hypothetical protein
VIHCTHWNISQHLRREKKLKGKWGEEDRLWFLEKSDCSEEGEGGGGGGKKVRANMVSFQTETVNGR